MAKINYQKLLEISECQKDKLKKRARQWKKRIKVLEELNEKLKLLQRIQEETKGDTNGED